MGVVPFDKGMLLRLAILIAVPMLPLALTMFSLENMIDRLLNLVM